MQFFRLLAARLRALFHRDVVAGEINEELQFHWRARVTRYEREGLTPDEARAKAGRRVGNLALHQDRGYDVRGGGIMETIWQDIRYSVRRIRQQPGFSSIAIITLALGIGVSTAIFSVIDAALLRPLPYAHPERLVRLAVLLPRPDGKTSSPTPSLDDMRHWQTVSDVFSHVAGYGSAFDGTIADGPEPERVSTVGITEDYLPLYGVVPKLGRAFTREDTRPGASPIVMLGHAYWQRRFGGREDVIGQSLRYDNTVATIVGVLPRSFSANTPVFRPLQIVPEEVARRGTGRVSVIGRLQPGITIEEAERRLSATMPPTALPDGSQRDTRVRVTSILESTTGGYRTTVYILASAVGFILLIGCVNVAGLLLGRGATRQAELALRASLGAGRWRLVRQLLTESLVLAVAGGVVGIALAWLSLDTLVANIPMSMPSNSPARVNLTVLGATALLLVPTTLIFGLAPALRLSRTGLSPTLARGGRQHGTHLSRRTGQFLIGAEVALAVILVAGAGLMLRSFARVSGVDLGFTPDGVVTMEVLSLESTPEAQAAYYTALLDSIRHLPGIESAGAINIFNLGTTTSYSSVRVDGASVDINPFSTLPGYFEALKVPVRAGRLPTAADVAGGQSLAVINETAARAMFPNTPAIGRTFTRTGDKTQTPIIVAAVVGDMRHGGPMGEVLPQVHLPYRPTANDTRGITVVVRPSSTIPDLAQRLRQTAYGIGPRVLVERIRGGNDWLADRIVTPRRRTVLLSLLGGLGLVLAMVGVFGMTAYSVTRRTREIGVRMVFGAQPGAMVARVVRDAGLPILIGTLVGLGGAALATKAIASFLFQTAPIDAPTFAVVALVLVMAGFLAAWLPARRAARVDPVSALRAE